MLYLQEQRGRIRSDIELVQVIVVSILLIDEYIGKRCG